MKRASAEERPPKPVEGEWKWNEFKGRWIEIVPFEQSFGAQLARAERIGRLSAPARKGRKR